MKNNNEKILFCATSRAHVDSVCANNFDWTKHRSSDARYGKGLYWDREAWLVWALPQALRLPLL